MPASRFGLAADEAGVLLDVVRTVDDAVLERLGHRQHSRDRCAEVVAEPGEHATTGQLGLTLALAGLPLPDDLVREGSAQPHGARHADHRDRDPDDGAVLQLRGEHEAAGHDDAGDDGHQRRQRQQQQGRHQGTGAHPPQADDAEHDGGQRAGDAEEDVTDVVRTHAATFERNPRYEGAGMRPW